MSELIIDNSNDSADNLLTADACKKIAVPERETSKFRASSSGSYSNESLKVLATSVVRSHPRRARVRALAQAHSNPFGIKRIYSCAIVFNCKLPNVSKTLLFIVLDARKSYLSSSIRKTEKICHLSTIEGFRKCWKYEDTFFVNIEFTA